MSSAPLSLLVAGTRSGSGKTTLALCLMAALRRRKLTVQAFKAGPDFIDPGYHEAVTGRPSCNLDSWMAGEHGLACTWQRLLHSAPAPDIILGEGVMGLFDGAQGVGGPGSTAHLARFLRLPLLLVVDARGMGQTAAALALGCTSLQPDLPFAGIVCTHVGGPAHATMLREAFEDVFAKSSHRIPLLGLLPRKDAPELTSRHLGLVMAHERQWGTAQCAGMAQWLETHLDVDALLDRCAQLHAAPSAPADISQAPHALGTTPPHTTATDCARPRIGIARDEAFCFLYAHMPAVLEELGAECVFFSPLRDTALPPDCTALYFPGGYPELHAERLAANAKMLDAVRAFAASGRRLYGECGGYMYLMQGVEVEGRVWAMTGCLPLRCRLETQRAALGYREVQPWGEAGPSGRGHEFHYARLLAPPVGSPLWQVCDRKGENLPPDGLRHGAIYASWVHLCPYGSRELLSHIFQLPKPKDDHAP